MWSRVCHVICLTLVALIVGCVSGPPAIESAGHVSLRDVTMWYQAPAETWVEGLPIGNGHVGAMVLGSIPSERIALNHSWLWRKNKLAGRYNPRVAHHLPKIRQLFFEGKIIEASNAAIDQLGVQQGITGPDPFQPVGDLFIDLPAHEQVSDYRRQLDLSTGVVSISYRLDNVRYRRDIFVSRRDGVVVVRLSADRAGALTASIRLSRIEDPDCVLTRWVRGNRLGFEGRFIEDVRFAASAMVLPRGGQLIPDSRGQQIEINRCDEVLILLSMATNEETDDSKDFCRMRLDQLGEDARYANLLRGHVANHRKLFSRVSLSLGEANQEDIPTNERLASLRAGRADPGIMALYFQYGRYLLMSSSQAGGVPANLQGIWNENLQPPWGSDLHHDCNIQMNYWPAEVTNLSECAEPLFDYVESMVPAARDAAQKMYDCRGIFIPITGNPWARCLKTEGRWSEWSGAGPWLAQHFWWRWEFTGDREFLRDRVYPLYQELALFYQDYLVEDPRRESPHYGKLVPVPSYSPENHFVGGVEPVSLSIGATMDLELIHEVFTNLIAASEILEVDAEKRGNWQSVLDNLPPLQIGQHGQLQEWLEDYEEGEIGHRHISHLYGLFPGNQITAETTPEFARASRVTLERRLSAGGSGWPAAQSWYGACFARLGDGDQAYDLLYGNFSDEDIINDNLFSVLWGNTYQIDGNFAGAALIAELLLQSHNDQIRLLPALPKVWPSGQVRGLVARGGFEVDIAWENGRLTQARILSRLGNVCQLRSPTSLAVTAKGKTVRSETVAPNVIAFDTRPGDVYIISPP